MARKTAKHTPALEWASAIIGFFITVALLGFLAVQAIRETEPLPPVLEASPLTLHQANGRFILELKVSNASSATGAGVQVEATLSNGGSTVETSSTSISYVPGNSHRRAGLVFTNDPRENSLELRVLGYESP